MIWRIDLLPKLNVVDCRLVNQIKDLGIGGDFKVYSRVAYLIEADLEEDKIREIAHQVLIDPIIEDYSLHRGIFDKKPLAGEILITYNPGVCDVVALSLDKAIKDLSLTVKNTRTAKFISFDGLTLEQINDLAPKIIFNPLIEHIIGYDSSAHLLTLDQFSGSDYNFKLKTIDLLAADSSSLDQISKSGCLSLNRDEMKIIKDYFRKLKRNPTDCELETIAVLWSEHCGHKTFRGIIDYEERDENGKTVKKETIKSLLKSQIAKATAEINSPDCVSVFSDNSGVVKFDRQSNICFKVETHNHPSSLEPYGGASTGIGGVIRDILGTGKAAKPFASLDVFCFSPWKISYKDLPPGLLHPKRIIKGVVGGVRDYGNRMGIPTVAGAVLFDQRFLGNPLVYCGTLGIMPPSRSFKKVSKGEFILLAGAKTGRDGIHGATFSSKELDEETVNLTSAVQIGNPIEEKKLTEAILRAADENLFDAITDCGAGGLSSAATELAEGFGARIDLEKVPLKYRGLSYTEIWISESQERMVFFAKEKNLAKLKEIFQEEDVDLTVIGEVTDTNKLMLFYQGANVCEMDMDFIFNLPKLKKSALWQIRKESNLKPKVKENYNEDLKNLLARPNIAPKDWILREYDHEVQGGSVVKSISGIKNLSLCDAAVVRPKLKSKKCVAIGVGINPHYSAIDPYQMAALAIDEALRNLICVGAKLDKTYILDNFSWGSPEDPELLGGLVRAAKACYDFSTYFSTPFISGKDSLYNEYTVKDKRISIPSTLLISGLSVIDDYQKTITADFKKEESLVYLIGLTKAALGASEYFRSLGISGGKLPRVDKKYAKKIMQSLSQAIERKLVLACHDLSEGGLSVAISEMCTSGDRGATIFLNQVPCAEGLNPAEILFSESPTRFIVEVAKGNKAAFEKHFKNLPLGLIGCTGGDKRVVIFGSESCALIDLALDQLRNCGLRTFEEFR